MHGVAGSGAETGTRRVPELKKLLLTLLFFSFLEGTEYAPWFPRNLELQPRATYMYQEYSKVNVGKGPSHRSSHDNFLNLSLSGAYKTLALEIEASAGSTHHRCFTLSDVALTGRYQLLDDVLGDPVSLTVGLNLSQVFKLALHDISNFYHGGIELEGHLAIGKEWSAEQFWISRGWAVLGFGVADHGSPWVRANVVCEKNCWDLERVRLFAESLFGLGHNTLTLKPHFRGYGPIRHQSIDLGLVYTHFFECGLSLDLGYSYRLYARNCPQYVNRLFVSLLYPFGL